MSTNTTELDAQATSLEKRLRETRHSLAIIDVLRTVESYKAGLCNSVEFLHKVGHTALAAPALKYGDLMHIGGVYERMPTDAEVDATFTKSDAVTGGLQFTVKKGGAGTGGPKFDSVPRTVGDELQTRP